MGKGKVHDIQNTEIQEANNNSNYSRLGESRTDSQTRLAQIRGMAIRMAACSLEVASSALALTRH